MTPNNSPTKRGLPAEVKGFDTISSHSWTSDSDWPSEGDPPVKTSKWTLQPADGEAIVLTGVVLKCSVGLMIDSSMIVEAIIADGIPAIKVAEYPDMISFLTRSDDTNLIQIVDPGIGCPIRKPVLEMKFNFSQHLFLWSSAGMSQTGPKKDKLGIVKFKKMVVRIGDNVPYKMGDESVAEVGTSRYYATIYSDPDY